MKRVANSLIGAGAIALFLAACGDQELILAGERLDLRDGSALAGDDTNLPDDVSRTVPITLPATVLNSDWTHVNGNAQHRLAHPALGATLTPIWSVEIGQGNDRKHRITADPVLADGRILTLDSRSTVMAHSTTGAVLWSRDLTPIGDNADDASGGGIAIDGGTAFVTTGFGTLTALDVATGETQWVQKLDSAATGAPTAVNGAVYLVTRNSTGWAIDASNGRVLWQLLGAPSDSGIAGGPAPASAGNLIVFPFGSGQMIAAVEGEGTRIWAASVAGERSTRTFSKISDITGDPVVAGDVVYAGNHSGRAAAFDRVTGQNIWSTEEGALSPVWLAGGSVFLVSDENRVVRLDAATGETIWATDLPLFTKTRIKKRKAIYSHYGPVLAGGRLLVASNDEKLRSYDPGTGSLISSQTLPAGATTNPVVAGATLYLVTENGQLHAFR